MITFKNIIYSYLKSLLSAQTETFSYSIDYSIPFSTTWFRPVAFGKVRIDTASYCFIFLIKFCSKLMILKKWCPTALIRAFFCFYTRSLSFIHRMWRVRRSLGGLGAACLERQRAVTYYMVHSEMLRRLLCSCADKVYCWMSRRLWQHHRVRQCWPQLVSHPGS